MNHEEIRNLLPAYAMSGLDPADAAALQEHLRGCEQCQRELASYGLLRGDLGLAAPEAPLPEGAKERMMERAAQTGPDTAREASSLLQSPPSENSYQSSRQNSHRPLRSLSSQSSSSENSSLESSLRPHRRRRITWRRLPWIAAAGLVALVVGLFVVLPQIQDLRGPPQEPLAISTPASGVEAEGSLVAHTWGTEAKLLLEGLDDGQRYRATFTREDGTIAPAGTFIGTEAQPVACNLNAAVLREDATRLEVRTMDGELIAEADLPEEPASA